MKNKKVFIIAVLLSILMGCNTPLIHRNVDKQNADSVLAMNIKAKLIESNQLNAAAIQVEANKGIILLSGFVDTPEQKQTAQAIAKQIHGVKKINNQITVK